MRQGAVTSPSTHPLPDWNAAVTRGERIRFLVLVSVVAAVVCARWIVS
jgi:hypothetical protein